MSAAGLGFIAGVVWTLAVGVVFGWWLERRTARAQMRAWQWDRTPQGAPQGKGS